MACCVELGGMIVRCGDECRGDFLQRVISHPSFVSMLERNAVGVTLKNLNAKTVAARLLLCHPLSFRTNTLNSVSG